MHPHDFYITHFHSYLPHTYQIKHAHLQTYYLHCHTYKAYKCQVITKPGTTGMLITAMPSYQLLRRPVGEGGILVVAIAASLLPDNSLPQGKISQEVGDEVGRSRGQQFNRAMWSSGTSLVIIVFCTNHSFPQMQHYS